MGDFKLALIRLVFVWLRFSKVLAGFSRFQPFFDAFYGYLRPPAQYIHVEAAIKIIAVCCHQKTAPFCVTGPVQRTEFTWGVMSV